MLLLIIDDERVSERLEIFLGIREAPREVMQAIRAIWSSISLRLLALATFNLSMKSLARNWIFSTLNFLYFILFLARQKRLHEFNIQLASSQTFETQKLRAEKMIGISERVACIEEDFQVV